MNPLSCLLLLVWSLSLAGCASRSLEDVSARIRYLQNKEKYAEAVDAAVDESKRMRGKDRSEVLLMAAEISSMLYQSTGDKKHLLKTQQLLGKVIKEKTILDGRPQDMAATLLEHAGKYDKAIQFVKKAEKMAGADGEAAGQYLLHQIQILRKCATDDEVADAARVFLEKYPKHSKVAQAEAIIEAIENKKRLETQTQPE